MTPDAAYNRFDLGKFIKRLEKLEMYQMWDLIDDEITAIEDIDISQPTTPEGRDVTNQKQKYRAALSWFGTVAGVGGVRVKPSNAEYFYPLLKKLVEQGSLEKPVLDELK